MLTLPEAGGGIITGVAHRARLSPESASVSGTKHESVRMSPASVMLCLTGTNVGLTRTVTTGALVVAMAEVDEETEVSGGRHEASDAGDNPMFTDFAVAAVIETSSALQEPATLTPPRLGFGVGSQ